MPTQRPRAVPTQRARAVPTQRARVVPTQTGARAVPTEGARGTHQVEDDGLLVEVVSRRVEQHAAVLEAREVVDQSLVHHKLKHTARQIDILVTYMYSTSATQLQL